MKVHQNQSTHESMHQNQSIHESINPMSCRATIRVPISQISYQKLKQSRSGKPASGGPRKRRRDAGANRWRPAEVAQGRTGEGGGCNSAAQGPAQGRRGEPAWRPAVGGGGGGGGTWPNPAPASSVWSTGRAPPAPCLRPRWRERGTSCWFSVPWPSLLMGLGLGWFFFLVGLQF